MTRSRHYRKEITIDYQYVGSEVEIALEEVFDSLLQKVFEPDYSNKNTHAENKPEINITT